MYCPKEKCKVLKWMENEFTCCKSISSDAPIEYHSVDDLQVGPATAALIPKFILKGFGNSTALTFSQSMTDCIGSALIGAPVYIGNHNHECTSDHQILWVSGRLPNEVTQAVRGSMSSSGNFPTTIQEAIKTPYWPLVKQALEDEIRGKEGREELVRSQILSRSRWDHRLGQGKAGSVWL